MRQPDRLPGDGSVTVSRDGEFHFIVKVVTDCKEQSIRVSHANAWRVFGSLAVMLGIELPKKLAKSIRLDLG